MPGSIPNIQFASHLTRFILPHPKATARWIEKVVLSERGRIESLSYVFCTDSYLLKINQAYLAHDTLTDIVTFDLRNVPHGTSARSALTPKSQYAIEGEIYISIPRVRENARNLGLKFEDELDRVIIHGVLHLLGYGDKTLAQKSEMRRKEEACLSLR